MYDVCIVGAGVNGSAAAYSLSKQGKNVLLLEQFPTPHTRGSSHGQTRVIRCMYYDVIYGLMSRDSFPLWKILEEEVGEELIIQNGYLEMFDQSEKDFLNFKRSCLVLDRVGVKYELLSGKEVNTRFPPFNVPATCYAIYEPEGGTLLASKCVNALQRAFVNRGGRFQDGELVREIIPGDHVRVVTQRGEYTARSLIITAGPFTSKVTSPLGLNLPLRVERVHPCYWKLEDATKGNVNSKFPTWKGMLNVYGLAALEYPGLLKICEHSGTVVDPDSPEAKPDYSTVQNFIKLYMTGVEEQPSIIETCIYTITPDNSFILDTHPRYSNIIIGAGFSGTGFKMAPVTGNILADMALGKVPSYDISHFQMSRFPGVIDIKSQL